MIPKSLKAYVAKRDLKKSREPQPKRSKTRGCHFVVQKHAASHLHYDFRLEIDGVLKSWAIPKGPSLSPADKRLAIEVEDHPLAYKDFEGIIPEGYGAGAVIIWDQGVFTLLDPGLDPHQALKKGSLPLFLRGKKLKGAFSLSRMRDKKWLLIKKKDRYASTEDIRKKDRSVVSKRKLETLVAEFNAYRERD